MIDITRLTALTGANPDEVERLIVQIENRAPDERTELLGLLARVLGLNAGRQAGTADPSAKRATTPRTDLADAAAADLGFD